MDSTTSITVPIPGLKCLTLRYEPASVVHGCDDPTCKKRESDLHFFNRVATWVFKYQHLNGITDEEIVKLIAKGKYVLQKEPSFIHVYAPVLMFGDIHGNFADLLEYFKRITPALLSLEDPGINLLFLGDYVDRGPCSLEVAVALMCLKLLFPTRVHLLRGNHESSDVNKQCRRSFYQDVVNKRNGNFDIWARFNNLFKELPLCALVNGQILCMHGGIPRVKKWKDLENVKKPNKVCECYSDTGLTVVNDLLWSDPTNNSRPLNDKQYAKNEERHTSIKFNDDYIREFFQRFPFIKAVVRGHEHVRQGHRLNESRNLCTLFTAPRYDKSTDFGSVLKIWKVEQDDGEEKYKLKFYTLKPEQGGVPLVEQPVEPLTPRPSLHRADYS